MRQLIRTHARQLALLLVLAVLPFWRVLIPVEGQAIGGYDMRGLFYPWLEFAHNAVWQGRLPLWDASHFAGYPFLANPQVAFFYPPTWFALILPVNVGILLYLILHVWLAGAGIYLFAVNARSDDATDNTVNYAALIAAVSFMFSSFVGARIFAGHIGLLAVHAWMGWLLLASDRMLVRRTWSSSLFAGVTFAAAILAGHTTSLFFVCVLWGLYTLYRAVELRAIPLFFRQMLVAFVMGLLLSAVQVLPMLQLAGLAARSAETSYEFAARFSLPLQQLFALIVPNLFGEPANIGYWGAQNYDELTAYVGIIPIVFALFALFRPKKRTLFWLSIALLGALLALGDNGPLHQLVFNSFPPFRLTRAPARALFLTLFSLCVLTAQSLPDLYLGDKNKTVVRIALSLFVVSALIQLSRLVINPDLSTELTALNRAAFQSGQILRSYSLLVIVAILLIAAQIWRGLARFSFPLLLLLVVVDLATAGQQLVRNETIVPSGYWYAAAQAIEAENGDDFGRILPWGINIFDQNNPSQVGLDSVFGYNALELASNVSLYEQATDPRSEIYDRFAATHVVSQVPLADFEVGENGLQALSDATGVFVYVRPNPKPYVFAADHAEAQAVCGNGFNTGEPAVTNLTRDHGFWRFNVQSDEPVLLVTSETSYPGWQLTVDGNSAEWQTVLGGLRGFCMPAGTATVQWTFRPPIFLMGGLVSVMTIAICTLIVRNERSKTKRVS